jgi:hypothetical protein
MMGSAFELFEPLALRIDRILRVFLSHAVGVPASAGRLRSGRLRFAERETGTRSSKGGTADGHPFVSDANAPESVVRA